ncbi:transcriptional regulator BetI [Roseobacteraceae bacterium S113]
MKSKSIGAIRRSELSRATFEAVVRYGLRGTTLEKVGEIAGVSKGVVLHHFKGKSALLEAVFRRSNNVLSDSAIELFRYADTPYERLWAIIIANFNETIFNRAVCQAWVSLMAEVPHNVQCQRIQNANNQRIKSNFLHELKHFVDETEVKPAARHLGMLIDAIWVRNGSLVEVIDSQQAIDEMEYCLLKLLPNDDNSVAAHAAAREKIETIAKIALGSRAFQEKSMQA